MIEQFPFEGKRQLYRIIQELLSNARKHSDATEVSVVLRADADFIYLQVQQNGMGLLQIDNRLRYLQANWEWKSETIQGVQLNAKIPRLTE